MTGYLRRWLAIGCIGASLATVGGCRPGRPGAVAIKAKEYAFEGAPSSLTVGEHTFALRNVGRIDHEMVIVRLPAGVSLDQVLAEPPYQAQAAVTPIGRSVARAGRNGDHRVTAAFTPGTYVLWCFLSDHGPPHIYQGMRATFSVP